MSVITITKDNFSELTTQSVKPVLLDFWAPWCAPCRMLSPVVDEIAEENDDIIVGKVNVDEQMELAMSFKVASIPTLIVMEAGQQIGKTVGYTPKEEILELLGK